MLTYVATMALHALCGKTKSIFISFSPCTINIGLTPLRPEPCWNLTPKIGFTSLLGNPDFAVISLSVLQRAAAPFIEDCGSPD